MINQKVIQQLLESFKELQEENRILKERIIVLEEKLSKYENPKNSNNSSIPPSQDPNRETRSTRKKSNKNVGGQKGHKGFKLDKISHPDEVILHNITHCECCNSTLPEEGEIKSRQIFDILPIKINVAEHRIVIKKCTNCGAKNKSNFPEGLVQEAQYGNRIKSLAVYLQNYQMIPYARSVEMVRDLTGHKISSGSLANFQLGVFDKLNHFETELKKRLLQSAILHADETGVKTNGKSKWMHVASNELYSWFGYHSKRGGEAIDSFNILNLYNGTLIHDRFSSYFNYGKDHGLCNAHILRELLYIWETQESKWVKDISNLLVNLHHQRKNGREFTEKNYQNILKRWEELISPVINGYNKKYKKTKAEKLAFALEKHKHYFLNFVKNKEIPFDNNLAERDLRMIKVKQKISGGFRQDTYGMYFARIKSFIKTLKKNNLNVLENIHLAMTNQEFYPILAEL